MAEEFSSTEISFLYFLATYPYICICVCIMFSPTSFFLLLVTGTEEEGSFDCISFFVFFENALSEKLIQNERKD